MGWQDEFIANVQKPLREENERLRAGIQNYLDGNFGPPIKKSDKCPHGLYGYEVCGQCIDDHFAAMLSHQQLMQKEG